jgi:peroxiredoxin
MLLRRIILGCVAAVMAAGCWIDNPDTSGEDPVQVGDPVPAFSVTLQDGSVFDSRNSASWPAVIVFFHTTCPDCQITLPLIQQLYDSYQADAVRFVCISRAEGPGQVQSYWDLNRLSIPWSAQLDRSVYSLFALSRIPRVYVVDRRGTVRAIFADNPCPTYEELSASLEAVLE